jgi:small subunit ribosomal protein S11
MNFQKEFETTERNTRSMNFQEFETTERNTRSTNFPEFGTTERNTRSMNFQEFETTERNTRSTNFPEFGTTERNTRSMNFVRGILEGDRQNNQFDQPKYGVEHNADIVHVKLMRNNTFVTVTDSKGNKKFGASSGMLSEMKGGPKLSRYAAEATAEHVGRLARNMGLKTFVVKVNGFTYFKKKKQAILSFREGYTNSRGDQNPIVYIEDTTRKAHNGCRLPKKRRV